MGNGEVKRASMKALTLRQPMASAVAAGLKTIETRTWRTKYRGPLAIHAAKGRPLPIHGAPPGSKSGEVVLEVVRKSLGGEATLGADPVADLPRGSVVALARLVDVQPIGKLDNGQICVGGVLMPGWKSNGMADEGSFANQVFGDFGAGRWAWFLEDVLRLGIPHPINGALGIWEWEGPKADEYAGWYETATKGAVHA